jgi:[protein-PII] uridylyltransferase
LLGYRDGVRTLGVEDFMALHYRNARAIARLVDCMPDRARRLGRVPPITIRDVGGGIMAHDGQVTLLPDAMLENPVIAMRLYKASLREGLPPSPEARDAVAAATEDRDFCRALRADPEANALFLQMLTRNEPWPLRGGSVLEELHENRLLLSLLPEFEPVTGRVRFEAHQVYTVDAHGVVAVDRLRQLARGEFAHEHVVITRCAAEMVRPVPLYLAVLLHGLGANHPDHPERHGAAIAGAVGERLGLEQADIEHLQWLMRNQNELYRWALRRDITDPETIAHVAGQVKSLHRLRDLYLLTFATQSTASPTAMSEWSARMLQDLWTAVSNALEGRQQSARDLTRAQRDATEAVEDAVERARIERFIAGMPERYFLANNFDDVRWHAEAVAERTGEPVIAAMESSVGSGTRELLVATDDRPGLLADLTAALATTRFSVDAAQLYTRKRPGLPDEAFDLFHLRSPDGGLDLDTEIERLTRNLQAVLSGQKAAAELVASRPKPPSWTRPGPRVRTEIHIDNAASRDYTVIDVYTRDRKDLLHSIARTLHEHGLTIALAKVNTEGSAVADVFYVQTLAGGKLAGEGNLAALSRGLRDTIRALDEPG